MAHSVAYAAYVVAVHSSHLACRQSAYPEAGLACLAAVAGSYPADHHHPEARTDSDSYAAVVVAFRCSLLHSAALALDCAWLA